MSTEPQFGSLIEYVKFMSETSFLNWCPPAHAIFLNTVGIDEGLGIRSVVLDRRGEFQTELFLASKELKKAAIHRHPGVDSYELFVAGDFLFSISGVEHQKLFPESVQSNGRMIGENPLIDVPEDAAHGATLNAGACFFSFQHWKSKEPTSVGDSFEIVKDDKNKDDTESVI